MSRHYVYRDYRPGRRGQFASESTFNRSQAQGVECHVHKELIESGKSATLDDLFNYEDLPDEELFEYEFHGTGDTGRKGK